uniref:Uncharacterized protein n=1 Tax=Trieres chinensis TaxID=1514140 RepID=A0A7S1ZEJ6_TRICV|mmetsp:Transcript_23669/g.47994  ORF Transcript_23669/g.47994 Transcript_23669/m.47994 type:complete len:166 (+) Transcript_23669:93-590(+)
MIFVGENACGVEENCAATPDRANQEGARLTELANDAEDDYSRSRITQQIVMLPTETSQVSWTQQRQCENESHIQDENEILMGTSLLCSSTSSTPDAPQVVCLDDDGIGPSNEGPHSHCQEFCMDYNGINMSNEGLCSGQQSHDPVLSHQTGALIDNYAEGETRQK